MAITDVMNQLEKQVADATSKQKTLEEAELARAAADKSYSESLSKVESLKTQLVTSIGNIFPARIRQS